MNGAGISAPAAPPPAATPAATPGASATAAAGGDADRGADFAALLDAGAETAAANDGDANAKTGTDKPAAGDDAKTDAAVDGPADGALPDWLQALRVSVALVGAVFAPTPAAAPAKLAAPPGKPPAKPDPASTLSGVAGARTDAAIAALTPDTEADPALPADTAAPTADRRFDALLATMGDRDAPPLAAGDLVNGALAALPSAPATHAPAAAPPMTVPPDHPQFANDLGERIVWITDAGLSSARIELHPLDLGSVSVHVQMQGDTAQVSFAADNPATRALLQDSLPQLRELMSVQGLQLLRAQVEQKVGAVRASDTGFPSSRGRDGGGEGRTPVRRITRLKLVDAYV